MALSVLVLYDHKGAAIEALAGVAAEGVESSGLAQAQVKRIEEAVRGDLLDCDAIMLGSPNWSGVTGSMKLWLDDQGDLWEDGSLAGKPGAALTSGWGRHSGLEMTLLQLIHWMLACGHGRRWASLVRPDASFRFLLWRHRHRRGFRGRLGPSPRVGCPPCLGRRPAAIKVASSITLERP